MCFMPPVTFRPTAVLAEPFPAEPPLSVDGGVEPFDVTNGSGDAVELELNPPPAHPSLDGLGWNAWFWAASRSTPNN